MAPPRIDSSVRSNIQPRQVSEDRQPPGRTVSQAHQPAWKQDAKVVDQLHPEGADQANYVNGTYNCAGAVAATVARMLGTDGGKTDAQLIEGLSEGRTAQDGTTPTALLEMLQDVGAKVDGTPTVGAYSDKDLDSSLDKGDVVVAQVGLKNNSTGQIDPHYVMVEGKDNAGNYLIKDPLRGQYKATADQLREAVYRAPGAGGMLIPIAPAEADDNATISKPQEINNYAQVTKTPFDTNNQTVQGVDTTFQQYHTDGFDTSNRHHFTNDSQANNALFGRSLGPLEQQATPAAPQHVQSGMTPQGYAKFVLGKLSSKDDQTKAEGQQLLNQLKDSRNPEDQQAYSAILNQYAHQPGIGQRVGYSGYGG